MQVLYSNLTKKQEQYLLNSFDRRGRPTNAFRGKFVGSGATANVYSYSRDKIVRVQRESADYEVYVHLDWVKLCLRNRFNCVPKYSFVAVDNEEAPSIIITVTERLQAARPYLERKLGSVREAGETVNKIDTTLNQIKWNNRVRGNWKTPYVKERSVRQLFTRADEQGVYINDLHSDNFMFRKNGQLVITDPCC